MMGKSLTEGSIVATDPFFVFSLPNFFDTERYERLSETFPDKSWFTDVGAANKLRLNMNHEPEKFAEFIAQNQPWQELVDYFSSEDFLTHLHALVGPHVSRARGYWFPRAWNFDDMRIGKSLLSEDVRMHFEFSRLERGSAVPAHTDAPAKIVSIILYFPDEAWKEEYGGGTIFYKTKSPRFEYNWFNRKLSSTELTPFLECPFAQNTLLLFLKSKNSYHGVSPLKSPEELPRNSLNINIFAKPPRDFKRLRDVRRRLRKRFEQYKWKSSPETLEM